MLNLSHKIKNGKQEDFQFHENEKKRVSKMGRKLVLEKKNKYTLTEIFLMES